MISPIAVYFERCDPNWSIPPSVTKNHILFLVTDGSFVYTVDGDELSLTKGDIVYVPEGMMRSAYNSPLDPHHM
ncbi:MAG: AraC family transcriptional regulator [Paenibacillus sp.]|jgi:quercetin dioxygenase-like cupin family protein|nr:AraC family transcriptional regulator [Paenibacillus sp.]